MKEPNYVMRIMDTGGQILVDDTCKEIVRIWKENGADVVNKFNYNCHLIAIFVTTMWLTTTTTSGMNCHQLNIHD